jgi:dUTP pyrophosphatase
MYIEYFRMRDSAQPPRRANPSDAGMDLAFAPDGGEPATIRPGESMICATGLKFGVPHGYMLQIMNRSSIAAMRSLIVGAHVVDAGYDGEVFINLHNVGQNVQTIEPGERIAQAVLIPVVPVNPVEYEWDDLYSRVRVHSSRGDGALGSTDEQ